MLEPLSSVQKPTVLLYCYMLIDNFVASSPVRISHSVTRTHRTIEYIATVGNIVASQFRTTVTLSAELVAKISFWARLPFSLILLDNENLSSRAHERALAGSQQSIREPRAARALNVKTISSAVLIDSALSTL